MKKLWNDECGAIISAELVLVMTILGIGMVVGLKTLQASVLTELGDVAAAFGNIDQTYTVLGTSSCDVQSATQEFDGGYAWTSGWSYTDAADHCSETNGGGINVATGSAGEGLPL